MSLPKIPDLNPNITIDKQNASNLILSSIGMEELSLSHILNAEAEKVQHFIKKSVENKNENPISTLIKANESANSLVKNTLRSNMLLNMKLGDTIELNEPEKMITITNKDDYVKIIENAPENSVITLKEGLYQLNSDLIVSKKMTIKGNPSGSINISVNKASTIQVKSRLNLKDISISSNNEPGYAAITLAGDNAELNGDNIDIYINQSGTDFTFEKSTAAINVLKTPGDSNSGSPEKSNINLKDSLIAMYSDYSRAISYSGGTQGKLTLNNVTVSHANYETENKIYSRGISIYQDTDQKLDVNIVNSKILGLYYPFYINCNTGSVNVNVSDSEIQGYGNVILKSFNNSEISFDDCKLQGNNFYSGDTSHFTNIEIDGADSSKININNTKLICNMENTCVQFATLCKKLVEDTTVNFNNSKIEITTKSKIPDDYAVFYNTPRQVINLSKDTTISPDNLTLFNIK